MNEAYLDIGVGVWNDVMPNMIHGAVGIGNGFSGG